VCWVRVPGSGFRVPGWVPGSGFVPGNSFTGSRLRVPSGGVLISLPSGNLRRTWNSEPRNPESTSSPGNLERTRNEAPNGEPRTRNWSQHTSLPGRTREHGLLRPHTLGRIFRRYTPPAEGLPDRHAMPAQSPESKNRRTALKNLVCRNCHRQAFSVLLITDYHLYLRCDHCGQPLAIPERRRVRESTRST